jgi:hypothetical protein
MSTASVTTQGNLCRVTDQGGNGHRIKKSFVGFVNITSPKLGRSPVLRLGTKPSFGGTVWVNFRTGGQNMTHSLQRTFGMASEPSLGEYWVKILLLACCYQEGCVPPAPGPVVLPQTPGPQPSPLGPHARFIIPAGQ